MRCPDCNKFVSFDTDEDPEVDLSVDDEGVVTGTVRIVNKCAECGTELKEATLDVEIDLSGDVRTHKDENHQSDEDSVTLEIGESDASRTERSPSVDRNGRPIRNPRYRKTFYGAEVNATVRCSCGEEFTGSDNPEVQASCMDELI
jgi:hypothetical protein